MRIGIGFDVHKFVSGRPLILGGVDIPFEMGLEGHSDADVLTHAIIDAMLGAVAAGDLGYYFPDTDAKFRGISSIELLKDAVEILRDKGYRISNIDAIAILEEPKLGPFKQRMREEISAATGLDISKISIKATTTEGLGYIGRRKGVAAQAVALVEEI
ncbi:MAG: 2-C-methyl-D-erythritol 2,4-cyclodiphosphate synthase [Actinobacteria bacterium]|nr:2-C-methyl-D-erythritol 2,4-cyclodiphosphate synthase [Actinomycetota bacterium]